MMLLLMLFARTPTVECSLRGQASNFDLDRQRRFRFIRESTMAREMEEISFESEEEKSSKYKEKGRESKGKTRNKMKDTKAAKTKPGKTSKASKYKEAKEAKAKQTSKDDFDTSQLASGASQEAPYISPSPSSMPSISSTPTTSMEPSIMPTSSNEPTDVTSEPTKAPRPTVDSGFDIDDDKPPVPSPTIKPSIDPTTSGPTGVDDDEDANGGDSDATDGDDDVKKGVDDEKEGDGGATKPSDTSPTNVSPDAPRPTPSIAAEPTEEKGGGEDPASKPTYISPADESPDVPRPTPTSDTNSDPDGSEPTSASDGTEDASKPADTSPTSTPLDAPLPTPTSDVINEPTGVPQEMPDLDSGKACEVPSNLLFGNTTDVERQVEFFYQMETDPSVTRETANEVLLPLVENSIAHRLLTLFFSECREESTMLRGDTTGVCEAQGYSGFPADRVLDGVPCVGPVDPTNSCFVVDSEATLYFESDTDCPGAISKSRAEIKSEMESGEFNNLDARIVNITYLDVSDLDFSSLSTTGNIVLPVYAWALIGLAGVGLIASVAVFARRRLRSRDEEAVSLVPVEGVDNAGESPIDQQVQGEVPNEDAPPQDDAILLSKMESQDYDEARPPKDESQDNAALLPQENLEDADENNASPTKEPNDVEVHDADEAMPISETVPITEVSFSKSEEGSTLPELGDISGDESSDTENAENSEQGNNDESSEQDAESETGEQNVKEDKTGSV